MKVFRALCALALSVLLVGCTSVKDLDTVKISSELKKINTSDQSKVQSIVQPYVDSLKLKDVSISFEDVDSTTTDCIVTEGKNKVSISYRHDLIKANSQHYSGQLQELERQNPNRSIMENKMYDILVKDMGEFEVLKISINTDKRTMDVRTTIESCTIRY